MPFTTPSSESSVDVIESKDMIESEEIDGKKLEQGLDKESIDAVQMYLREIGKISLIDAAKERELAKRIEEGDEEAKNILIKANLRLVVSIAKKYVGRSPRLVHSGFDSGRQFRAIPRGGKIQLAKKATSFPLTPLGGYDGR